MFPHITQKLLTTDTFHWLVLIPNSQLSIVIQFEKNNHSVFLKLQKICKKITKRLYFWYIIWGFESWLKIIHAAAYIACRLTLHVLLHPDSRNCFFIYLVYSTFVSTIFHFLVFISPLSHFDQLWHTFYNSVFFIANRIQFHYNIRYRKFSLNCKRYKQPPRVFCKKRCR